MGLPSWRYELDGLVIETQSISIPRKIVLSPPSHGRCDRRDAAESTFVVGETSRRTPAGALGRARRLRARRLVERRLPPQRHGCADRTSRGLLLAITAVGRASSSLPPSTVSSIRGSATSGSGTRAARRRSTSRRKAFVVFLQNHDQIATSGTRRALSRVDEPWPPSRDDRLFLADAGHPDAVPGAGIRRVEPVLYFADHESGLSHDVREGRRRSLAQFPSLATSEMRADSPIPATSLSMIAGPAPHSRRAAASPKPGASRRCCAVWKKLPSSGNKKFRPGWA